LKWSISVRIVAVGLVNALNETGGNMCRAAARMGMSLYGLRKAVKRLGIETHKDNYY